MRLLCLACIAIIILTAGCVPQMKFDYFDSINQINQQRSYIISGIKKLMDDPNSYVAIENQRR